MKIARLLIPFLAVGLTVPATVSSAAPGAMPGAAPAPVVPTLVDIRAGHRDAVDRIVYEFKGGVPESVRVRYVDELRGDASDLPIRIAGQAVLRVRFELAKAHNASGQTAPARIAFPLPNIMTTVRSGDFEAVTTYGIGLAKRARFRVVRLDDPARVVIRVRAGFPTVDRKVFFFNEDRYLANNEPFFVPRLRPVRPVAPATGVMDRLFAGPLPKERAHGLRLLRSAAKDYADLSIEDGVARVRLTGGCSSGGSTVSIAGEIMPTLRQFDSVDWVKIYDPAGTTEVPTGDVDSIPECLEP
ncbi:MAG TPA: hypothetical protein VFR87_14185 [Nocardioidaceae bacterium]|nr:hypothetical protein [Nocardioidaceae bacterium]